MKEDTIDDLKKRIVKLEEDNARMIKRDFYANRVITVLLSSGALKQDALDAAKALIDSTESRCPSVSGVPHEQRFFTAHRDRRRDSRFPWLSSALDAGL